MPTTLSRLAVVCALIGALVLAGCSHAPGLAASTNTGFTVTRAQLDDAETRLVQAGVVDQPGQGRTTTLTFLLRGQIARALAAQKGIQLTAEQRQAVYDQAQEPAELMSDPVVRPVLDSEVDFELVAGQVTTDELRRASDALGIDVNPEFGRWDHTKFLVDGANTSLSRLG